MKDIVLGKLNKEQQEAVLHEKGPLLIIAGAGSGKTRTLTHRIVYLIASGVTPESILAVTFTNKAAQEMKQRTAALLRELAAHANDSQFQRLANLSDLSIGTFHAISARFLRTHAEKIGYKPSFTIYDRADQLTLLKAVLKENGVGERDVTPMTILNEISRAKSLLSNPEQYQDAASSHFQEMVAQAYHHYQQELRRNNAMDFDDLIMQTVVLLRTHPPILAAYQERFQHILIDEYQDTNTAQYEWTRLLSAKHRNLCVCGDDYQAIYAFRNADFRNILNFEKDYRDARVIKLEQNYRSTKIILAAADTVIKENQYRTEKTLWTDREMGEQITLFAADDEVTEAQYVADTVLTLEREGFKQSGIAVLYRTNAQSRALEDVLIQTGMPYQLVGAVRFYERKEVKDMMAYLRLLDSADDQWSFKRIIAAPPRGIGPKTAEKLLPFQAAICAGTLTKEQCAGLPAKVATQALMMSELFARSRELLQRITLAEYIVRMVTITGYDAYLQSTQENFEERVENIKELASIAATAPSLRDFLTSITLMSDADTLQDGQDQITLMTLHAAKGLEFPVVFIVGMEEGVFPHYRSFLNPQEMEEERRLCYVGITRAKDRLYITFARRRRLFGRLQANPPSRFLLTLPEHTLKFDDSYV